MNLLHTPSPAAAGSNENGNTAAAAAATATANSESQSRQNEGKRSLADFNEDESASMNYSPLRVTLKHDQAEN